MTAECAVCYVSDLNFLLPSLVSATGLRKFVPPEKAGIYIFTADVDRTHIEDIARFMRSYSIRVRAIDENTFGRLNQKELTNNYIPLAMFGRFFLDDLLPSSIKRIVYIDSDTWVERDPTALIEAIVPNGFIAASEDTISYRQNLSIGTTTRTTRHYFRQLGLDPKYGYFNSGVFAVSRGTWKSIAQEAYTFYLNHSKICDRNPDQSALNAVASSRRLRLSNKWNFQTQLKFWGADRFIEPHIYHFNRWPKPWMGSCDPWKDMYSRYELATATFNGLGLPIKKLSILEENKVNADNHKTYGYLKWSWSAKLALVSMGFQNIEKNSWLQ